jgi:hypothetical protein
VRTSMCTVTRLPLVAPSSVMPAIDCGRGSSAAACLGNCCPPPPACCCCCAWRLACCAATACTPAACALAMARAALPNPSPLPAPSSAGSHAACGPRAPTPPAPREGCRLNCAAPPACAPGEWKAVTDGMGSRSSCAARGTAGAELGLPLHPGAKYPGAKPAAGPCPAASDMDGLPGRST